MTLKLESKLFDKTAREETFRNVPYQSALKFREDTRQKMLNAEVTGNDYSRRGGSGFRRYHRASARGERLAVDTGNLVNNALNATRTGAYSAVTYIDDSVAPYGAIQQEEFDRQVMTDEDAAEAEKEFYERAQIALRRLL